MKQAKLEKILNMHYITYRRVNDQILAEEVWTKDNVTYTSWINVTDWNMKQLVSWLGY